jgi:hypothetical protein
MSDDGSDDGSENGGGVPNDVRWVYEVGFCMCMGASIVLLVVVFTSVFRICV